LVGGAVRDGLLGIPVNDKDFVVVGSSAAEMESLGFRPVGKDFPVFLHPVTQDEYALARTERKSGQGYKGFTIYAESDVTLEQDLGRRDLTINAMAIDAAGNITDPHGGQKDLADKVLRHVKGQAFIEDPVRILRLARFCARYTDFTVAPDTTELVRDMVDNGELDHLVPERVWQELSKGLMEKAPERMLDFLRETGALKAILPEVDALHGVDQVAKHHPEVDTLVHVKMVLQQAVQRDAPLEVRFACLVHDLGKGITPKGILPAHHGHEQSGVALVKAVCERLKVPSECRDLAVLTCAEHTHVHRCEEMKDTSIVKFLGRADAFRRPERFAQFVLACECDARGRLGLEDRLPGRGLAPGARGGCRSRCQVGQVTGGHPPADPPGALDRAARLADGRFQDRGRQEIEEPPMKAVDFPVVKELQRVVRARMAFFNAMLAVKNESAATQRPQKVAIKT
jgi:tRNA nucleotidyltransferase (CCA-adding enzyme)